MAPRGKSSGVDSPFFSTIVLFKNRSLFPLGFFLVFWNSDPWKEWGCPPRKAPRGRWSRETFSEMPPIEAFAERSLGHRMPVPLEVQSLETRQRCRFRSQFQNGSESPKAWRRGRAGFVFESSKRTRSPRKHGAKRVRGWMFFLGGASVEKLTERFVTQRRLPREACLDKLLR